MTGAVSTVLILAGVGFFVVGTVGLLRLPDIFSRLHALTKADNLGLGFIAIGLALQAPGALAAAKLILIWLVAMLSASTIAQLIALHARRRETHGEDWE